MTRTVVAVFGACAIAARALGGMGRKVVEFFPSRTHIDITFGVVLELLRAKEVGAVVVVRRGNVGMEVLALDGDQVLFGAVLAVAGGLPGPQFPAEARSPQSVEQRLVVGQAVDEHFGEPSAGVQPVDAVGERGGGGGVERDQLRA